MNQHPTRRSKPVPITSAPEAPVSRTLAPVTTDNIPFLAVNARPKKRRLDSIDLQFMLRIVGEPYEPTVTYTVSLAHDSLDLLKPLIARCERVDREQKNDACKIALANAMIERMNERQHTTLRVEGETIDMNMIIVGAERNDWKIHEGEVNSIEDMPTVVYQTYTLYDFDLNKTMDD